MRLIACLAATLLCTGCSNASGAGFGDTLSAGDDAGAREAGGAADGETGIDAGADTGALDANAESGHADAHSGCSVSVAIVDYFTGDPITGATATVEGAGAGSGANLCLTLGTGLHPVSIGAAGYATYNGAIQVPGGAADRTVRLFPVGRLLASWLALVNSDRAANGAPPVQLDDGLTIAAWDHAVDMGVKHYYAHFDPHGFAPTTRSLLLGSMVMGAENIDADQPDYTAAEGAFMAEKATLPNQSPSDCTQGNALAVHYCNIVWPSHNWVGLAIANVPGSPYQTYYDQEFGGLYAYYDTTVLPPEPPLGTNGSLVMLPASGQTFVDEYLATLPAPTPIDIATLNADMTCASTCPAGDQWFPTGQMLVGGSTPSPIAAPLTQVQLVFAAIETNVVPFVGAAGWAAFWAGGSTAPDSYGASSASYLMP